MDILAHYGSFFTSIPPQVATMVMSMLPIGELRYAIPIAIKFLDLAPLQAYIFGVIGNMVPAFFILLFIKPISVFLSKHSKYFKQFFDWICEKTHRKNKNKVSRWGSLALIMFVAIPLPLTGAWTACLVAFVFQIPFRQSFPIITLGALIAGCIVTALTIGAFSFLGITY